MKLFIFLSFISSLSFADDIRHLRCAKVSGQINFTQKTAVLVRMDGAETHTFNSSHVAMADERCGVLIPAILNFDITPQNTWGEYILQILEDNSGRVRVNLHSCHYDGQWSHSEDSAGSCSLN